MQEQTIGKKLRYDFRSSGIREKCAIGTERDT